MHTECCHPVDLIVEIKLLNGKVYHVCRGCGRGLAAFAHFCEAPDNSGTLTMQNKIETTSTALGKLR